MKMFRFLAGLQRKHLFWIAMAILIVIGIVGYLLTKIAYWAFVLFPFVVYARYRVFQQVEAAKAREKEAGRG